MFAVILCSKHIWTEFKHMLKHGFEKRDGRHPLAPAVEVDTETLRTTGKLLAAVVVSSCAVPPEAKSDMAIYKTEALQQVSKMVPENGMVMVLAVILILGMVLGCKINIDGAVC